ncbi:MAG: N-acetylmuramoyl-L-alanine amidase [Opitutae bacterium]|nr:N-acetylmuramoyl-L-alanine amidase [Opitutae bacterium]
MKDVTISYPNLMSSRLRRSRWIAVLSFGALLLMLIGGAVGRLSASTGNSAAPLPALHAAVEVVLQTAATAGETPRPLVRLRAATLDGKRLTLDFSRELLDYELGSLAFERLSREIHFAVGEQLRTALPDFEVITMIEGVPLHQLLASTDADASPRRAVADQPTARDLRNRRVAVSPGHGYYLNGSNWTLQRGYWSGIVEDFINHDIITQLAALLTEAGAEVWPTRNLDRNAGNGESGFPKWQQAARYHVKELGASTSIWNESGFTHYEQDIRCRPKYANSVNADILVSLHNNGSGTSGAGTGTETLYDTNNGYGPESKRLADIVHGKIITAIRRDYYASWTDRRVQGFNGSYGENRLATRPAILIELAFMDRPTPDNAALQDPRFRLLVNTAIREGIMEYLDSVPGAPATPTALTATGAAAAVALKWTDNSDNETGFRIERKIDGATTWSTLATVATNITSYSDTTALGGRTYLYRVQAFNTTGNSPLYSNEAAGATTPPPALVLSDASQLFPAARDWGQEISVTFLVADQAGTPVAGAIITGLDGIRNSAYSSAPAVTDAAGRLTYSSTVPEGQANATYTFNFTATKSGYAASAPLVREVLVLHAGSSATGAPTLTRQPAAQIARAGASASFTVTATGAAPLAYQWFLDGRPVTGGTTATLALPTVSNAHAGAYTVTVSNSAGSATSLPATLTVVPSAWLANVSVRTTLAAAQTVIVGFVVEGGAKDILVRAAGPTLAQLGLTTAMSDPRIELRRGETLVAANNDWPAALAPTATALGAFDFLSSSRDAALLQNLDGACTVHTSGTAAGTVVVEAYDAGGNAAARVVNLSARNRVGTGVDILIAGFVVAGTGSQRLLIRAVGPTLASVGVGSPLADPRLELHGPDGLITANDDWNAVLAADFARAGAFALPTGSKDSALVVTLDAGRSYTAQVSGNAGGTGEALVEVYALP